MTSDIKPSDDNKQSVSTQIFHFQNTLLNRTITVSFIATLFGLGIALIRIPFTGFQNAFYFHFFGISFLFIVNLLKNKLSFRFKLYSFIFLQLLTVIGGMISYGLLAGAGVFLACSCIMATIFAGKKLIVTIFIINISIISFFSWLYCSNRIECTFNPSVYMHSLSSWVNFLSIFVMASVLIVALTSALIDRLKIMIIESVRNGDKIRTLNNSLEQRVEQRTKELSDLNKQKDRILGMVAHDISNKLGGLLGYLDLINISNATTDCQNRAKFISRAIEAGADAQNILTDLLEFASNNKEPPQLIIDNVNIHKFISESIECHYPKSIQKGVEINIESQRTECNCDINRGKMSRVFDNLLTNALKFTPEGGTITISIHSEDNACIVKVKDTGIGIPESLQSDIFTPFSNSGRDGTAHEKSNGLGLSICRQIVELHRGAIWFESEEGKGSTFFVKIPQKKSN